MRIVKAMEFGASWQKEFDHHVTHIIIDQANTFEQLLKFLRMKELPVGHATRLALRIRSNKTRQTSCWLMKTTQQHVWQCIISEILHPLSSELKVIRCLLLI